MRSYEPAKIHNVGLFGHGGSGKTTLTEALLLTAKAISRAGRVEDGNTVSDYDPDEQKRRQSINLSIAPVEWKDDKINFIDVPGYADFAGEIASAMRVIDGAVIVLDAAGRVHHDDRSVQHPHRRRDIAGEIGVAGRVEDVDLGVVPFEGRDPQVDRHMALLLIWIVVADGVAVLDAARAGDGLGGEQQRLGERGLPAAAMAEESDIADFIGSVGTHQVLLDRA